MVMCVATHLVVMGCATAENTITGILLVMISCLLFLFEDYRYQELKDRIEKLEQKGDEE